MLRILLAESDRAAREAILDVLRSDSRIQLVGLSDDGTKAVAMAADLRPDLVLMGVRLRTIDGLRATNEIMIECPTPILLVNGIHTANEVDLAVRALGAGALSVVTVPSPEGSNFLKRRTEFLSTVMAMSEVKVVRRWRAGKRQSGRLPALRTASPPPAKIVAIASSTGGPAVLEAIIRQLPTDFPAPILIVQHIAAGFLEGVASWLNQVSRIQVKVARHGESLSPGVVYLAPDDRHLGVSGMSRIMLSDDPPIGGFRPSATYLFMSVARSFGCNALAVILTGMGRDGVEGLRAIRKEGGKVIAQDEATSVVFGMPRAAIEEGVANWILSVSEISKALQDSVLEK